MEYKNIEARNDGNVAVITINRAAKGNTLTLETYDEVAEAVRRADEDANVGAIILTGAGADFSLGVDVAVLDALAPLSDVEKLSVMHRVQKLALTIHNSSTPIIAKVHGRAMGAGCDVALACDIVLADETALFGEMYANLALVPDGGGTWLVSRLVGLARAKEMIFTGKIVSAAEAERIGLINYAVKAEELDEFALQFARKLAKGPTEATAASKALIHAALGTDLAGALAAEAEAQIRMFKTDKHRKRVKAFLRVQQ